MTVKPWSSGEEDFLSAWHQALAKYNPFLPDHPHPVVQDAQSRGADIRELMLLHDCFIKKKDPLQLLERELPEEVPWPWSSESYAVRIEDVSQWAKVYYAKKNLEITQRLKYAPLEDNGYDW